MLVAARILIQYFKHSFHRESKNWVLYFIHKRKHSDPMNAISHEKVCESIAKFLLKSMLKTRIHVINKMYISRATTNYTWVIAVNSKPKAFRHFKVDRFLKMYATFLFSLDLCETETDKGIYCVDRVLILNSKPKHLNIRDVTGYPLEFFFWGGGCIQLLTKRLNQAGPLCDWHDTSRS